MSKFFQYLVAMVLTILIYPIALIVFSIRKILQAKPIFEQGRILDKHGKVTGIKRFSTKNWLIANTALMPMVLISKLAIIGIGMRNADESLPKDLHDKLPGIFSLYFIRRSSRIAFASKDDTDREYLAKAGLKRDLSLLLQGLIALMYHEDREADDSHVNVFEVPMLNTTMKDAIELLDERLQLRIKTSVYFVNADCLNKVFVDKEYHHILKGNELNFPDGSGITLAGKMLGTPLKENVNGTDMLPRLCELCVKRGYKMYLLGAAPGVANAMQEKLVLRYPGLQICGVRDGFFDKVKQSAEVIKGINECATDILLVAFGAPLQEKFIHSYMHDINANVQMGVGGLFDFYSERMSRAPLWMRQIGMEWVFRLIMEPKRMWKRYIIGNPVFLTRVYLWKKSHIVL